MRNEGNRNAMTNNMVRKNIENPNIPMTYIMDDQRDNKMERCYWGNCEMRDYHRTIFKTENQLLAESMQRNGFEVINVTPGWTVINKDKPGEYRKSTPVEYTLWGVGRRMTSGTFQAIRDGVLWKIGFKQRPKSVLD